MRQIEQIPDFGMEDFDLGALEADFDINAAFQGAMSDVATNEEVALEEKVRRMEVIVTESNSEVYRDFVEFRSMAAEMEMYCNHDDALNQAATQGSETLSSFMDSHDEDDEIDPRTGKKKKKRHSWFGVYI